MASQSVLELAVNTGKWDSGLKKAKTTLDNFTTASGGLQQALGKDSDKMQKFVQMMGAKKLSYLRHTGLFVVLIECWTILFSIHHHTTELIDIERSSETSNALLLEDCRTSTFVFDGKIAYQEEGREYH